MIDTHFMGAALITLAITIAIVVAMVQAARLIQLCLFHATLRRAIDRGVPVSLDQLDRALGRRPVAERAAADMRNGVLLVAIAFSCIAFGAVQTSEAACRLAAGIAIFPGVIGIVVAFWGLVAVRRNRG